MTTQTESPRKAAERRLAEDEADRLQAAWYSAQVVRIEARQSARVADDAEHDAHLAYITHIAAVAARQALKENTDKRYDASTPVRFPAEPTLHFTPGQVITLKRSSHAFIPKENAPHVLSPEQSTLRARLLQTARTVRLRHDAPKP
jgi:hypothetical protein